jgi:hypothetical protein
MRLVRLLIAVLATCSLVAGCSCDKKKKGGDGAAAVESVVQGIGQPTAGGTGGATPGTDDGEESGASGGFALSRMIPEQLSNNFAVNANYGAAPGEFRSVNAATGQTFDYLLFLYGVPLGGIDFVNASVRDPSTKAQTLLIARNVAWSLGQAVVWKEFNLDAEDRVVFAACDLRRDRPYYAEWDDWRSSGDDRAEIARLEEAWLSQVAELWWRFYSRPPTEVESEAVKTMFVAAMAEEGYPAAGWIALLYAIFSTQEFWHT